MKGWNGVKGWEGVKRREERAKEWEGIKGVRGSCGAGRR
jgi:hypothetical protein